MNWDQQVAGCQSKDPNCLELSQLGQALAKHFENYTSVKLTKKQAPMDQWVNETSNLIRVADGKPCTMNEQLCAAVKTEAALSGNLVALEVYGKQSHEFIESQAKLKDMGLSTETQLQLYKQIEKENMEVNRLLMVSLLSVIIMISLLQALNKWNRYKKARK